METNENQVNTLSVEEALKYMETDELLKEQESEAEKKKRIQAVWKNQMNSCMEFFNKVAELLSDIYEVVPGGNKKWPSFCLVPKGTASQVTYYGKPVNSLRVASNWNWRASLKQCGVEKHIQCVTSDLPFVKQRPKDHPEWASPPIFGNMVALFDTDKKYHCVFGEKYLRDKKQWTWMINTPIRVANMLRKRYEESQNKK